MEKASILKKKSDARKNKTRAQRVNPNAARKELLAKKLGRKGKRGMDEPETREVATASSRHAPTGAQISAPAGRCHGGGRERPRDISPESDAETTTTTARLGPRPCPHSPPAPAAAGATSRSDRRPTRDEQKTRRAPGV